MKMLYRIQEFKQEGPLFYKLVQLPAYDDNLDMISRIIVDLKEAFLSLVDTRRKWSERGKFCLFGEKGEL